MAYQWDDIAREWSLAAPGPFTRDEIVEAFNALARLKGKACLEQQRARRGGTAAPAQAAVQVVDLWRSIRHLVDQPQLTTILAGLGQGDPGRDAAVAAILRLAAHCIRGGARVVLEEGEESPGLRVRSGRRWVQCRSGNASLVALQRLLYDKARGIGNAVVRVGSARHLEIYLVREPSAQETGLLKSAAIRAGRSRHQPVERQLPGLGTLFSSHSSQERLRTYAPSLLESRPKVEAVVIHSAPDSAGRSQSRRFTVQMPFTEERALDLLEEEEAWFPPEEPGLLIFDLGDVPGSTSQWQRLLQLGLAVGHFPGIGAVLLTRVQHPGLDLRTERELLVNPVAKPKLPARFLALAGSGR